MDPFVVYMKDARRCQQLSPDELASAIQDGTPESLERAMQSLLRYCIWIARKWTRRGVDLTDLIQEANSIAWQKLPQCKSTKGHPLTYLKSVINWHLCNVVYNRESIVSVPYRADRPTVERVDKPRRSDTWERIPSFADLLMSREPNPSEAMECDQWSLCDSIVLDSTPDRKARMKRTKVLTFSGRTLTVEQWAAERGIRAEAMISRLSKMSLREALSMPAGAKRRRIA